MQTKNRFTTLQKKNPVCQGSRSMILRGLNRQAPFCPVCRATIARGFDKKVVLQTSSNHLSTTGLEMACILPVDLAKSECQSLRALYTGRGLRNKILQARRKPPPARQMNTPLLIRPKRAPEWFPKMKNGCARSTRRSSRYRPSRK